MGGLQAYELAVNEQKEIVMIPMKFGFDNMLYRLDILSFARMFYELPSRDREDGRATGHPQDVGPEAYLNGTSQGATSEDAQKEGYIRGRSRSFMKHAG